MRRRNGLAGAALLALLGTWLAVPSGAGAAEPGSVGRLVTFGIKVAGGGRFDNVRMCVASPQGTRGGPAADIAFYAEVGLDAGGRTSLVVTVPVMRPILFAAAFRMLQLEPEVALVHRVWRGESVDLVFGPTLGLSLHYGPDFDSPRGLDERTASFFALGPMFGAYLGLDFTRPGSAFNFQLGAHPYFTPMTAVSDPENHKGVVVGGMLEGYFRFARR
jgi:hypothetical protein